MEVDPSSTSFSKPRIVSWTPEEDGILRDQVRVQGTEKLDFVYYWRRGSPPPPIFYAGRRLPPSLQIEPAGSVGGECKKGGWSQEEDALLCEAQKIYGNRWIEISKVVSGRTDNAVKNRFNTLSKKRAKHTMQSNENENSLLDCDNKRIEVQNASSAAVTSELPTKKIKCCIPILDGNHDRSENVKTLGPFPLQNCSTQCSKGYQTDDMKKVSQSFLLNRSSNLEHSIETTCVTNVPNGRADHHDQECSGNAFDRVDHILEEEICGLTSMHQGVLSPCRDEAKVSEDTTYVPHSSEYNSPFHTVSPFWSFADMIPSPNFSASERRFLMDLFVTTSPSPKLSPTTSNEPSCKKQLLHSL